MGAPSKLAYLASCIAWSAICGKADTLLFPEPASTAIVRLLGLICLVVCVHLLAWRVAKRRWRRRRNEGWAQTNATHSIRFSLRQLLLALTVVAVLLSVWVAPLRPTSVTVRVPRENDQIYEWYTGYGAERHSRSVTSRNVAVITGTPGNHSWLTVALHRVEQGRVYTGNSIDIELGYPRHEPDREHLKVTLALGDENIGWTMLGSYGGRRTITRYGSGLRKVSPIFAAKVVSRKLVSGRPVILYVEGDRRIVLDPAMTIGEFATKNSGRYLVVTGQQR